VDAILLCSALPVGLVLLAVAAAILVRRRCRGRSRKPFSGPKRANGSAIPLTAASVVSYGGGRQNGVGHTSFSAPGVHITNIYFGRKFSGKFSPSKFGQISLKNTRCNFM
jgi:hypothetical protein